MIKKGNVMYLVELHKFDTGFMVYLDMDGVIVDFELGAKKLINEPKWLENREQSRDFWKALHSMTADECEDYWANLSWMPGGKELWKYLKNFQTIILSKPDKTAGFRQACEKGKARWLQKNLQPTPKFIFSTEKWRMASPNAILIDDHTSNTIPFEDHGGAAIIHNGDPKRTINILQERFGFPKR